MKLVTGASGLLGSEIISYTSESIGLSSKDCDLTVSSNTFDEIIRKNKIKTVIHCAAKVGGVKANTDFIAEFFDQNIKMNLNVFETCKNLGVKLVSVLSTCIYPDAEYVRYPLTEDQLHIGPPHHSNFGYAYAKRMLDVQSRAYRQQYGCNFISAIPNNLYGINDNYHLESSHVIPALIRKFHEAKISQGKKVKIWGSGAPLREFTFARDAAKIILWLSDNYDGNDPINIGNPEQITIKDLALMISEIVGFEGEIEFDSSKPDGQHKKPSSNEKLIKIGWSGSYTPLKEGLAETIKHFQNVYPRVRGVTIKS